MTAITHSLAAANQFNVYLRRDDPAGPWLVSIERDGERAPLPGLTALVALLERLGCDSAPAVRGLR